MDIRKQALINTTGNVVYLFALWLLTVITTHVLDYEAVGELTLAMAVGNVVLTVQMYGVRSYQSSDVTFQHSPDEYLRLRIVTIACGWLFGFFACITLGLSQRTVFSVIYFTLIKTSESFSDVLFGNIQRAGHLEIAGYSMAARGLILTLLFLIGSTCFRNLNTALAISAVGVLALSLLMDYPLHRIIVKKRTIADHKQIIVILKDCFPLFVSSMLPALITALPRIFLERHHGAEMLGFFGNVSTPSLLLTTVIPTILIAFLPRYGELIQKGNYREAEKTWLSTVCGTCVITLICIIGVKLLGKPVLSFVYTDQILPYVHHLYGVLIAMMLYAITMCCNTFLVPMRKNWGLMMTALSALAVCVLFSAPMVKEKGIAGAVAALMLSYGTQAAFQIAWIIYICREKGKNNKTIS